MAIAGEMYSNCRFDPSSTSPYAPTLPAAPPSPCLNTHNYPDPISPRCGGITPKTTSAQVCHAESVLSPRSCSWCGQSLAIGLLSEETQPTNTDANYVFLQALFDSLPRRHSILADHAQQFFPSWSPEALSHTISEIASPSSNPSLLESPQIEIESKESIAHQDTKNSYPRQKRALRKSTTDATKACDEVTQSNRATTSTTRKVIPSKRSRAPSQRYREKIRQLEDSLTEQAETLADERDYLVSEVTHLKEEVLSLKNEIIQHGRCDCEHIQRYISEAANAFMSNTK
jgi:hypothetical protein